MEIIAFFALILGFVYGMGHKFPGEMEKLFSKVTNLLPSSQGSKADKALAFSVVAMAFLLLIAVCFQLAS